MKKHLKIIIFLIPILFLISCSTKNNISSDNIPVTTDNISANTTSSEPITSTTTDVSTTNISYVTKYNNNFISKYAKNYSYSTGNYFNADSISIYRGVLIVSTDLVDLIGMPDYDEFTDIKPLPSSIYNNKKFIGIGYLKITYKSIESAKLYYSLDKSYNHSYELDKTTGYITKEFNLSKASYFKIDAGKSMLYIKSIELSVDENDYNETTLSYTGFRVNPKEYDMNNLVSGVTKRSIDILEYKDNNYFVKDTLEYIYYDRDDAYYILSSDNVDDDLYSKMVLTNPVDVANYYLLFNDFPVNYYDKSDATELYYDDFIKDDLRCVSEYSRTDGYVKSVPMNYNNGAIKYYELDIKLEDGYEPTNRGVGRIVIFTNGFKGNGYDDSPVIVYTDDHYITFNEYNNAGSFINRFNAQGVPTPYSWTNINTIEI